MKFDIKKTSGYHATKKPQILERPGYRCLCINGAGDPNGEDFSVDIQAMYACAYGLKMGYKNPASKLTISMIMWSRRYKVIGQSMNVLKIGNMDESGFSVSLRNCDS
ncbi:Uncharacterized conserved protein [Weissella viridescens]|uniref:Uncharacterized conserved protein n=1 Tax=Weissella viridescens TaxID=1629 RepID=A0A380NYR7_WEIVI|nr:Uncharacterized conserved protein [Weissella viridescens]